MNGKFHWLQRDRISSIDLANEKWAVIEKPCNFKGGRNSVMLGVLRSDLSVFCNYLMSLASPCRADIWVMKEYGVKESWTKMFTVISPDVMSQMRVPPILMSNDLFLKLAYILDWILEARQQVQERKSNRYHYESVCKSWLELISSPEFVKNHLLLSTTNKDYNHHGILLKFASKNEHGVKDCSLRVVLYHPETGALVDLDYPEIEKPCNFKEYHHLVLGVLGSDLSVLCNNTWRHTDVWVMKEYGVKESWTKMLAIKKSPVGFRSHIENSIDVKSKDFKIPQNVYRVLLEVYVSFHENDESWYGNLVNEYLSLNNLSVLRNGVFREVIASLDEMVVDVVWPFTVIYIGGDEEDDKLVFDWMSC
ncbi:hypothetical protein FXO37_14932 [Capsicum annuum]|nr:hypothetical protein FXO37_14932 [Capsicum annuum]